MAKPGIRSVAEMAGVSIGTVSKILSPASATNIRVSEETRLKVLTAAQKLNYQPSYGAKLLRGESTRTIGFAVTLPQDHGDAFLSSYTFRILNGIGREAALHNYQVLLIQGEDYRHYMDVKRVDALVMTGFRLNDNPMAVEMREMFERFNRRRYPYVVINSRIPDVSTAAIEVDNRSGMKQVAELMLRNNYPSAGFIGELTPNPQRHHTDRIGFLKQFLAGTGCRFDDTQILNGSGNGVPEVPRQGRYSHEDGKTGLRFLAEHRRLPRCIVCGNDDIAIGLLRTARELGIRVPEELAVIGFDDDYNVDYLNPALTTVHHPLEEFGQTAVRYLLDKITDPDHTIQLTIEPHLIERSTT